jgi:hypothetical protein
VALPVRRNGCPASATLTSVLTEGKEAQRSGLLFPGIGGWLQCHCSEFEVAEVAISVQEISDLHVDYTVLVSRQSDKLSFMSVR